MDLTTDVGAPRLPEAGLTAALDRARRLGRPVLLSLARPLADAGDLLPLVAAARAAGAQAALLERAGHVVAALGAAWARDAAGAGRFAALRDAAAALFADALVDGDAAPLAVAAFAFADAPPVGAWRGFPAARAVIPRAAIVRRGDTATLSLNLVVEPRADAEVLAGRLRRTLARLRGWQATPPDAAGSPRYAATPVPEPAEWQRRVRRVLDDLAAGAIDKLVLARTCRLEADAPFACAAAVERLRRAHPACTTFWFGGRAGDFLGATPEVLLARNGPAVATAALAGSCGRGDSVAADTALTNALLASAKDRREHAIVVDAIAAALRPFCAALDVAPTPEVLRLPTVQHLRTPIAGRLGGDCHILDLVAALHPTPAVGGHPRAAALARLAAHEGLERGWYAGPLGWFDAAGDGRFDVALRAALVRERQALLYAGAGIVAGSDPAAELAETRLKLQPLLAALMEL